MRILFVHSPNGHNTKISGLISVDDNTCDRASDWLSAVESCNTTAYDAVLISSSIVSFPPELLAFFIQFVINEGDAPQRILLLGSQIAGCPDDELHRFGFTGFVRPSPDFTDLLPALYRFMRETPILTKPEDWQFNSLKRAAVSLHSALRSKSIYKNKANAAVEDEREMVLAIDFLRKRFVEQSEASVISLLAAAEARDSYLRGHLKWAAKVAYEIGKTMSLEQKELRVLLRGTLLHDIGKIGIPDQILVKKAQLSPEERNIINSHPIIGKRILERNHIFEPYLDIVENHHERLDGSGYPGGKKSDEIPLLAQIVAVADIFSALTTSRPYRRAVGPFDALKEIIELRGAKLNADAVDALAKFVRDNEGAVSPFTFSLSDSTFLKF